MICLFGFEGSFTQAGVMKRPKKMKRCCFLSHDDDDSQAIAQSKASLTSKNYSFVPFLSSSNTTGWNPPLCPLEDMCANKLETLIFI